jgi:methionyl-tRNA formyltransferase
MIVGVIGNTELTRKGTNLLIDQGHTVKYVFGLPEDQAKKKVNAKDLASYCSEREIEFYKSNDFEKIYDCGVDLVVALGDSRLIPVKKFKCPVVGNHGAALPNVKGGASLVWARLINSGTWAVSFMTLDETLDSGEILGVNEFNYPLDMSMIDFVSLCDDKTIELLDGYINNTLLPPERKNSKTMIKVGKYIDSQIGATLAIIAGLNNLSIYLPARTPDDSVVKDSWDEEFKENFKRAHSIPYPQYR